MLTVADIGAAVVFQGKPLILGVHSAQLVRSSTAPGAPTLLHFLPSCQVLLNPSCFVSLYTYFEVCGLYLLSGFSEHAVYGVL